MHIHHTMELAPTPQPRNRKIHKVSQLLRQLERDPVYDPKVASFGPYHYNEEKFHIGQEAKRWALEIFTESSVQRKESLYQKVLKKIANARDCYIDVPRHKYDDKQFAEMILLDACFLMYLTGICRECQALINKIGGHVFSLAFRDMFLMENQIPLEIVMLLINDDKSKLEEVYKALHKVIWGETCSRNRMRDKDQKTETPLHLLEAFHRVIVWDGSKQEQSQCVVNINPQQQEQSQYADNRDTQHKDEDIKQSYRTFRSVKVLKARGIHFKASEQHSLKGINFKPCHFKGELRLPTWYVSGDFKVFFSNMIAYELCPENQVEDKVVISYVNFMKQLVVLPEDVQELRHKKILLTSPDIGSYEEVIQLYRELNTYTDDTFSSFWLQKKLIQDHYESQRNTWIAQLISTYFSSPWSIIAWLAGISILVLTILQTHFTINPK